MQPINIIENIKCNFAMNNNVHLVLQQTNNQSSKIKILNNTHKTFKEFKLYI